MMLFSGGYSFHPLSFNWLRNGFYASKSPISSSLIQHKKIITG